MRKAGSDWSSTKGDSKLTECQALCEPEYYTYKFTYNALDWLTAATYSGTGNYSTQYTYDKMGNFQTLKRYGLQDGGTYGLIDNLTFTLNGNQVTRIEDAVNDPTYNAAFNFVDGASQQNEYTYDQNGNMTKDLNKKISSIQYNLLNLPKKVIFQNGNTVDYSYNAAGERIGVTYGFVTSGATYTYCGNICYVEGFLKEIQIDGGYITFSGTTPIYHYYLKDHLGNNRVVCNKSGAIEQVNHYYPFGGFFGESVNVDTQRYKFNGKEFDRMHGLDWYNYGARYMSPDIGRFTTMDPMAENYYSISPYAYCENNPIIKIDEEGESPISAFVKLLAKNSAKNAIKTYAKNNIQRRLEKYMTKGMTKQFAKEVDDIVNTMDDAWWEVGLEMIPGAGDIYGMGKFGIKAKQAYGRLQHLENKYAKRIHESLDDIGKKKFEKSMRSKGVKDARKDQKLGVGHQNEPLYEKGNDVEGHHKIPVSRDKSKMSDPRNIEFMHHSEHIKRHKNE